MKITELYALYVIFYSGVSILCNL